MAKDDNSKTFNLKQSEANLLRFVQTHHNAVFSGLLSSIAAERLSYDVTERTQFKLKPDFSEMTITELPEAKPQEESPVKTPRK